MEAILCVFLGYLTGTVNPAYLLSRIEVHLSYIWNKDEELERLKDVYPEDYKNVV